MQDALVDRHEVFVATATVAAQAQAEDGGFRHRDVKFLIELFSNWVESSGESTVLSVQHTQVKRYLEWLVVEGYARQLARKAHPYYRLTRAGLLELLGRLVHRSYCSQRSQFFFLYYFIRNYRPRLEQMVEKEGRHFPVAIHLELADLLDVEALVAREISAAEKELKKLEARINDGVQSQKLAKELFRKRIEVEQATEAVERAYPYELNSQKPLRELISSIPADLRRWELEVGTGRRVNEIWTPCRELLRSYLAQLRLLKKTADPELR